MISLTTKTEEEKEFIEIHLSQKDLLNLGSQKINGTNIEIFHYQERYPIPSFARAEKINGGILLNTDSKKKTYEMLLSQSVIDSILRTGLYSSFYCGGEKKLTIKKE